MFRTVDSEDISRSTSPSRQSECSARDAQQSPESTQAPKQHRAITLNMIIKEIFFCIAFALTTYGALHNSPTKISKHPQSVRFFNKGSPVVDWYQGQLTDALTLINHADVSFVMYYAPWDAECQYVRGEFEKAASVLEGRVFFSAINCWSPGSECRLQHSKLPTWPIIMAYTVTSRGVLYKGPKDAQSMISFLELIARPLRRVSNTEDLVNLLSICDGVAIGFTPLSEGSKYYNTWYDVSLKTREFDTVGEICFASVTSRELATELGAESLPAARLVLWNDTREFTGDVDSWNTTTLLEWVLENFSQPVARVIPMWKKAFSFERYVDGNPILMLFTPLNPLFEQIPNYSLLREVAMEYYNCKGNESSQWISELMKLQQVQRLLYQQRDINKFCEENKFKKPASPQMYKKDVVSQNNKYPWYNTTQKNQKSSLFDFLLKRGLALSRIMSSPEEDILSHLGMLEECATKLFPAEKDFYSTYEQCQTLGENLVQEKDVIDKEYLGTTMLPAEDDELSPENLLQDHIQHYCKLMSFGSSIHRPVVPGREYATNLTNVSGLSCAKNRSLYFIAVDSVRNHHFAESLGIDVSKRKDMTAVVILDSKQESQYVLSEEYNSKTIREFIYNYSHERLKRSLRTHVADAEHTHYFSSDKMEKERDDNSTVSIVDLSTRTFRRFVNTSGKMSIVAVCGGSCPASTTIAIVTAARLLTECGVKTQVARLDALRHDLPWHFSPDRHPAVFVFPAHSGSRDADSISVPVSSRLTASAVLAVGVRAAPPSKQLPLALLLCRRAKLTTEKITCLRDVKDRVTTLVGRNLQYWHRSKDEVLKAALFARLVHLHQVHMDLHLLHHTDLTSDNKKQENLIYSVNQLAKHWDIQAPLLKTGTKAKS